ncbi:MAG TPA: hypothetical protein VFX78_10720 [Candidatus Eisenbacteria bacterium]|nr:hypothetical protein [Candidatus Eisenbacteria bacterium]
MRKGASMAGWRVVAAGWALLMLTVGASASRAQTCSPTQTNQDQILPEVQPAPKPALFATFTDPLYGTCFKRISDDQMYPSSTHNPVPIYPQLQAWNADQTLLILATGDLLRSPSYAYYKRLPLGGANFRWSPIQPNIGYFSQSNRFVKMDVNTDAITTLHTFSEYPGGLERGNEWEDVSRDDRFVVLEGYRTAAQKDTVQVSGISMTSGSRTISSAGRFGEVLVRMPVYGTGIPAGTTVQTVTSSSSLTLSQSCTITSSNAVLAFGASEVFVYDFKNDRKGTVRPGFSGIGLCGGIDDMLMSPSGKYALVHWGTGGNGQTCHMQAYDTSMAYVGQVLCGRGHYDLTVDKDGSEWAVTFTTNAGCGETGAYLAKYRIPDGATRLAAGDSSGFARLCVFSDLIGGGHVSGRAYGAGFVVLSADHPTAGSPPAPFFKELVKVYLDSRPEAPHLERLVNHRADEAQIYADGSCPLSSYWAQSHATISRDGTKVLWGSNWNMAGSNCAAEAYVMDLAPAAPDNIPPGAIRDLQGR